MKATAEIWVTDEDPPKLVVAAPYYPDFIADLRNSKITRIWDKDKKVYKFDLYYLKPVVDCLHRHFHEVIKTPTIGMYYLFSFLNVEDIEEVYKVLAKKYPEPDHDMRKLLDALFGRFWQLEKMMADGPKFRQFRFFDPPEHLPLSLEPLYRAAEVVRAASRLPQEDPTWSRSRSRIDTERYRERRRWEEAPGRRREEPSVTDQLRDAIEEIGSIVVPRTEEDDDEPR